MREDVRRDMEKGICDLRKSLPLLRNNCIDFGEGLIKLIKGKDGDVGKALDTLAGIDAYQYYLANMRGIAGRAQRMKPGRKPYRSFTIRTDRPSGSKTEYEKRLEAIKHKNEGAIFPHWTMQSYSTEDGSQVLCVGLAKTEELYLFIEERENNGYIFPHKKPENGDEEFLYVNWDFYKASGLFFYEHPSVFDQKMKKALQDFRNVYFIPDDDTDLSAWEKGMEAVDEPDRSDITMANDEGPRQAL